MIETVLPSLRDLIKDFIISTLEKGVTSTIYDQIDKINLRVRKDVDESITKGDFKEAAKAYLLASKALKEGARGGDKEVSGTIIDTALAWQKQAEQTLYDETRSYINKAYEYEKQNDYEAGIALKNKAKTLEYEINTGSLNKKLNEEVSAIYNSIRNDAYAEHGRIHAQNALKSFSSAIGRIFGHKSKESLPELKEESPVEETAEMHITPEQIIIKNDYKPSEISDGYYDWSVYLIANNNVMNQIESVTYTLHPTFSLPVQTVKIPDSGFRLKTTGWGEFQIKADINLKNGETITKYHWLDLGFRSKRKVGEK